MPPKKMPPVLQMATPGTKQRRASDLFGDAAESSSIMDIDDQPTPTPINPDPNRYTQPQETQSPSQTTQPLPETPPAQGGGRIESGHPNAQEPAHHQAKEPDQTELLKSLIKQVDEYRTEV